MRRLGAAVTLIGFLGCSTSRQSQPSQPSPGPKPSEPPPAILSTTEGGIPEEAIGKRFGVASLTKAAADPEYGYSEKKPVRVGGGLGEGGHNAYRYLNALLGPAGQTVHYTRVGTCCPFKTPNSPFGDEALLEVYAIQFEGGDAKRLYFDWYDSEEPLVPGGLLARK